MEVLEKVKILASAAKYDASCASSGSTRKNDSQGLGNAASSPVGICHSWAADGRCVSLLKILSPITASMIVFIALIAAVMIFPAVRLQLMN